MSERKLCGAKTRKGTPCRKPAQKNGRCHLHGGRALKGLATPAYKHGKYSKYLPAQMGEAFGQLLGNPDILKLREDIALLDLRIGLLLKNIETGESQTAWEKAQDVYGVLTRAIRAQDPAQVNRAIVDLGDVLNQGINESDTWREITAYLEAKRRLVESERKVDIEERKTLTIEELLVLTGLIEYQINQTVHGIVEDNELARRVSTSIGKAIRSLLPG